MLTARSLVTCALLSFSLGLSATAVLAQPNAVLEGTPADTHAAPHEAWFVELGVGINVRNNDGYNRALKRRGYERDLKLALPIGPDFAFGATLNRSLSLLVRYDFLESNTYRMGKGPKQGDTFEWTTRAVSLAARARLRLYDEWVVAFAELGCGLGIARPRVTVIGKETSDHQFGPALRAALGLTVGSEHIGAYVTGGYTHLAILQQSGHEHQDGGASFALGLRVRSMFWWW